MTPELATCRGCGASFEPTAWQKYNGATYCGKRCFLHYAKREQMERRLKFKERERYSRSYLVINTKP